jgi:transposase-like protein
MQIIQEAWVSGISTRKIERLAKSMGIEQISASQVSEVNKELDAMVEEFRNRPLQAEYPILWIDALYEKIRENGHVVSMAVLVVKGVTLDGTAQILAVEPMHNESEETYRILFQNLKDRGVKRVWLCISDAHKGLQAAIRKEFIGTSWQRCKVHFMRNILAYVGHRHKDSFAKQLKHIWLQPDEKQARAYAQSFMDYYEKQFPEAIRCLEEGLEDSLQFYRFDQIDHRKISVKVNDFFHFWSKLLFFWWVMTVFYFRVMKSFWVTVRNFFSHTSRNFFLSFPGNVPQVNASAVPPPGV